MVAASQLTSERNASKDTAFPAGKQEKAMNNKTLKSTMKMAAVALALTFVMSGAALARDDDDDYYRGGYPAQARQYGYQNGYRDGVNQGRHEGRENDPYDFHTPDWRQATRGYQNWMGPVNWYQRGYQEGYTNGFQAGFQSISNRWRDNDGDRDDWRNRDRDWRSTAYQFGYQDGCGVARRDIDRHNSYNPNPRGRFDDEDHGYRREYGSRDQYRAEYANGYRAGYAATMGYRY
jgi:hypothetical protein